MDSTNCEQKTVFSIHSWESVKAEGCLHTLFSAMSCKGLEPLQILVSAGVLQAIPLIYEGL